jgi:L-lactate dehydrogenase
LRDVSLSVPTVLGREGILEHREIGLTPKELQGLKNSAQALKKTMAQVAGMV